MANANQNFNPLKNVSNHMQLYETNPFKINSKNYPEAKAYSSQYISLHRKYWFFNTLTRFSTNKLLQNSQYGWDQGRLRLIQFRVDWS